MGSSRRRKSRVVLGCAALAIASLTVSLAPREVLGIQVGLVGTSLAQSNNATAIRVLRESRDFRARVRAALALGSSNNRTATPHLIRALSDNSPAVRAASATALGRLGDPAGLGPLRRMHTDRVPTVRHEAQRAIQRIELANPTPRHRRRHAAAPGTTDRYPRISVIPRARSIAWPRVRYVIVLGAMQNRSNFRDASLGSMLQREVSRRLTVMRGVAVIHEGHEPPEAEREIRRRRLPKLRLEGSLNRVVRRTVRRDLTVRCEVSIMLLDEPGRNIRSVLNGAATGRSRRSGRRDTQERRLAQQALEGAVRSAMSGASHAISSAGTNR